MSKITVEEQVTAEILLGLMDRVENPFIMYQIEKDVIKKALRLFLEDKEANDER